MKDSISGWDDWAKALGEAYDDWHEMRLSELHGFATGLLCVVRSPSGDQWNQVFEASFFDPMPSELLDFFAQEAEDLTAELTDLEDVYEFSPLLPDDSHALVVRFLALKDWANGFLTGFGSSGARPSPADTEMLRSLATLARFEVDEEGLEESEASEETMDAALADFEALYEFARMVPVALANPSRLIPVEKIPMLGGLSQIDPSIPKPQGFS